MSYNKAQKQGRSKLRRFALLGVRAAQKSMVVVMPANCKNVNRLIVEFINETIFLRNSS